VGRKQKEGERVAVGAQRHNSAACEAEACNFIKTENYYTTRQGSARYVRASPTLEDHF